MSLITTDSIILDLEADSQKEVLLQLANKAYALDKVENSDVFFAQLCMREQEASTGFGQGIAIPHARHKSVKEAGIVIARLQHPVEWKAMDGKPVDTCICLIAPDDTNDFHLKTLAKLARKLIYEEFITMLKTASKEEVVAKINEIIE